MCVYKFVCVRRNVSTHIYTLKCTHEHSKCVWVHVCASVGACVHACVCVLSAYVCVCLCVFSVFKLYIECCH